MRRVPADAAGIAEAARVIRAGGIVAIPTDTLYGLAADPFNPLAIARVFEVKGREAARALPLIAADVDQIATRLAPLPPAGEQLANRFWPGPLTLLIEATPELAPDVTAGTGRVGVRVPAHDVARRLCRECGTPLTATSANISREPATNDPDQVEAAVGPKVDLLLDDGRAPGGDPSTIVDVTGSDLRLVRAGAIAWDRIRACVNRG